MNEIQCSNVSDGPLKEGDFGTQYFFKKGYQGEGLM